MTHDAKPTSTSTPDLPKMSGKVSPKTTELGQQVMGKMLALDPDRWSKALAQTKAQEQSQE